MSGQPAHEGQEGDGGGAVHQGQEEGEDHEGDAVVATQHPGGEVPEEGKEDAGDSAHTQHSEDDGHLGKVARPEVMEQGEEEGADIGQLDDHCEVGGQVPALGQLCHQQGQLHPEPIYGYPGAHPKGADQQVCQEGHGDACLGPDAAASPDRPAAGPVETNSRGAM